MVLLRYLAALVLGVGLYVLLTNLLRPKSMAAARAIQRLYGKPTGIGNRITVALSERLAPFIRLSPYAKQDLMDNLSLLDDDPDPEFYVASNLISSGRYALIGLILLLIVQGIGQVVAQNFPGWVIYIQLAGWIVFVYLTYYAVKLYRKRKSGLTKAAKEKRDKRDAELPQFASYCIQAIQSRHDLYTIMAEYRQSTGPEFGKVLDKTLIRMRIAGPEAALQEFAGGMGSPLVADLVTGLIGASKGEDMDNFLANVEARFNEWELSNLNQEREYWYTRLSFPIFLCFLCMPVVFFTGFGEYLYHLFY